MGVTIITGIQWGDEGKGRISHYESQGAVAVVRATGGDNAGHTVVSQGQKYALHLLPSSIINPDVKSVIGNGVVVNPQKLVEEISTMQERGIKITSENLFISKKAHVILPWHILLDEFYEEKRQQKIGTTKRGIGPCYEEKARRTGIRMEDLIKGRKHLSKKMEESLKIDSLILKGKLEDGVLSQFLSLSIDAYLAYGQSLKEYICDTTALLQELLIREKEFKGNFNEMGKEEYQQILRNAVAIPLDEESKFHSNHHVVIEGAQATYLDIDHGTYPDVTSSNPVTGGALAGTGIGPCYVIDVIGVMKAYTTRVGNGPFPTEDLGEIGNRIRELGHEYGTTTGRPRRCGYLDAVMIKNAVFINGITALAVNHIDTIGKLPEIKVCVAYRYKPQGEGEEKIITYVPTDLENCKPIYVSFKGGWDTTGCTCQETIPFDAQKYLSFIERYVGCPVKYVGIGPDARDTILIDNLPF